MTLFMAQFLSMGKARVIVIFDLVRPSVLLVHE